MTLGLSLAAFTTLHVVISLFGIATGIVALVGMIAGKRPDGWTTAFLATTILTSVTGFMFPIGGVTPGIILGAISLVVLAVAVLALHTFQLAGPWRWIYVVTATLALYLNVLVAIVQSFQKIGFLKALAPTQTEPPFLAAQIAALALFVVLGWLAVLRFHPDRS